MPGSRNQPTRGARDVSLDAHEAPKRFEQRRVCGVCSIPLSAYNGGPNCYRHSVGMPWRGPSAKPKLD